MAESAPGAQDRSGAGFRGTDCVVSSVGRSAGRSLLAGAAGGRRWGTGEGRRVLPETLRARPGFLLRGAATPAAASAGPGQRSRTLRAARPSAAAPHSPDGYD